MGLIFGICTWRSWISKWILLSYCQIKLIQGVLKSPLFLFLWISSKEFSIPSTYLLTTVPFKLPCHVLGTSTPWNLFYKGQQWSPHWQFQRSILCRHCTWMLSILWYTWSLSSSQNIYYLNSLTSQSSYHSQEALSLCFHSWILILEQEPVIPAFKRWLSNFHEFCQLDDVMLKAWNQLPWEYLYHGNKTLGFSPYPHSWNLVVRHFTSLTLHPLFDLSVLEYLST